MKSSTGGRIAKIIKVLLGPSSSIAMKTTEIHHRPRTYHFTTFHVKILALTLATLIFSLSLVSVISQPTKIVYAEIFIEKSKKSYYVKVSENNPLILTLQKGDNATIRVDSTSQLKPRKVIIHEGKCSYIIFDDQVFVEARSKCEIYVYFKESDPKPPIYLLRISEQRSTEPGSNVTVKDESEWKVWGILITLLTTNPQAQIKSKYPVSLLASSQHIVNTSTGPVLEYEETYWITGKSFQVPGEALSITFVPIYYRIKQIAPFIASSNDIVYINKPALANLTIKIDAEKSVPGLNILSRYFQRNPLILYAKSRGEIDLNFNNFININIGNQLENLIIEANTGNIKVKGKGSVSIRPALGIPITVKVYTEAGDIASECEITSIAPQIEIPIELYNIKINLMDVEGNPLYNSTISLYRALKTITAHLVNNNSAVFKNLVKGEYIITIDYMGEEVAREVIRVERDSTFTIRTRVRSIEIKALNAKGDLVQNYTAAVYSNNKIIGKWHTESDTLRTPPLPFNNYTLVILLNNYEVWRGNINLKEYSKIIVPLKLMPIIIKVKNVFGAPLSKVSVTLKNNNTWSTLTDSGGRAVFNNIPFGNYTLTVKIGDALTTENVEINASSMQFISVQIPVVAVIGGFPILVIHAQIFILALAILIAVIIIWKLIRERGEIVIE